MIGIIWMDSYDFWIMQKGYMGYVLMVKEWFFHAFVAHKYECERKKEVKISMYFVLKERENGGLRIGLSLSW